MTDNTGRALSATIIGRNATSITVIRNSDGARFVIPHTRLSAADLAFVTQLPLHAAPRAPGPMHATGDAQGGILSFRRGKLDELDAQIQKNENLLYQMDPATIKARSIRSETNRLMNERAEVARDIADLKSK